MINYSGIGTYIRCLLSEYRKLGADIEFSVFGNPQELEKYHMNVRKLTVPIYSIREQLLLPLKIGTATLFHSPHYNAPLFYNGKLIVTIHDIIHIKFPEYLPSRKACLYARYMLKHVTQKAVRVITSSHHTKSDLIEQNVPAEKIEVIPFGVEEKFYPIEDENLLLDFRKKYGLSDNFILYVGNLKSHKNLGILLKAFTCLKKDKKIEETLVITAGRGLIDEEIEQHVKSLPFIPDDEMPLLYNCAKLFVFPSLYEGFGLPPLEAMACGVPVITSNSASIPEVVGDAGIMCDANDVDCFKDAILHLLTDDPKRDELKAKGIARAKSFSWTETAKKTIAVYRECRPEITPATITAF